MPIAKKPQLEQIGQRIRKVRGSTPQGAFATMVGIASQTTLSAIEHGDTMPRPEVLGRVVAQTRCDAKWLLTGEGEPFPRSAPARVAAGTPERLLEWVTPSHAAPELYKRFVPVLGFWTEAGMVDDMLAPPADEPEARLFLDHGPWPEGTIAVKLHVALWRIPPGAIALFGEVEKTPSSGMGLFNVSAIPSDVIAAFERKGSDVLLYRGILGEKLRAKSIRSFRPFLAAI